MSTPARVDGHASAFRNASPSLNAVWVCGPKAVVAYQGSRGRGRPGAREGGTLVLHLEHRGRPGGDAGSRRRRQRRGVVSEHPRGTATEAAPGRAPGAERTGTAAAP